jgi:hypothetical protein
MPRSRTSAGNWHAIGWLILLIIAAVFSGVVHAQTAPTLTFTAQTTTGNGSLVPVLTWSTSPAAQSCTASGDAAWTGTKAAAGTQTLAAVTTSKTYQMVCTWPGDTSALISWIAPTTNSDGSALPKCATQTDTGSCLLSFVVVRGSDPSTLGMDSRAVDDRNATSFSWTGLPVGTHWFSVMAINGNTVQSDPSAPPMSKTISSTQNVTRQVSIAVNPKPSPPTGITVK